jgi:hypothetical protein
MCAAFWASDAGLLIYSASPSAIKRPIVWIGRDGKQIGDAVAEDTVFDLALAPGGERIAMERSESGAASARDNRDIWLRDARGVLTRLTFDPGRDALPIWSPDGKQVAFSSDRESGVALPPGVSSRARPPTVPSPLNN